MLGFLSSFAATDSLKMISSTTVCTCCAIGGAVGLSSFGWGVLAMGVLATVITLVGFQSGLGVVLLGSAVLAASSIYSLRMLEVAC